MRLKYTSIIILLFTSLSFAMGQNSLHGKVTNATTGETMPGVIIYILQLKSGTISDSSGTYNISPIPKGVYTIEAKLLSSATVIKQVTINGPTTLNFTLSDS